MKRALISVSDKENIIEFCQGLIECDFELISTGGTLKTLKDANIEVKDISQVTNFPEILNGRVKTLSPYVHGGILYKRDDDSHIEQITQNDVKAIDLVCVNLYDFEGASKLGDLKNSIENIDIGGPSMIRSAAKNYNDVLVVTCKEDYKRVITALKNDEVSLELKANLCVKAFALTARYDALISEYLTNTIGSEKSTKLTLTYDLKEELRYGENPHQNASFWVRTGGENTVENCLVLHGKQLSYNNIQDTQAALDLLAEFHQPTICAIKHMTPCGVGIGHNIMSAWKKAYESDPVSIFGGIIVTNQQITKEVALKMNDIFLEVIVAPSYSDDAITILKSKKNIRILQQMQCLTKVKKQFKSIGNALLVQDVDNISNYDLEYECVTENQASSYIEEQLKFAMSVVKHVKSNGIVVVSDNQTVGIGSGQTSRIGSAKIALEQAKKNGHTSNLLLASDAFFPFEDVVELANEYGVSAIAQPGGSINDQKSIDKCNELDICMMITSTRHFKH